MPTIEDYYKTPYIYSEKAIIQKINKEQKYIVLDRTLFYPKGGGQKADIGTIVHPRFTFRVENVEKIEGEIFHYGSFEEGIVSQDMLHEEVTLHVDETNRMRNMILHTCGHLVDDAMIELNYMKNLEVDKGQHYPDTSYVSYMGSLDIEMDLLKEQIESKIKEFIEKGTSVTVKVVDKKTAEKETGEVLDYLPDNADIRLVYTATEVPIACAGTHVEKLSDIHEFHILKMKNKKGRISVHYDAK